MGLAAVAAILVIFPFEVSDQYLYIGDSALLAAIGAIGLNVLTGNAGQMSIGNAAFLGIGAYTVILTESKLSFLPAILLGGIISGAVGLVIGVPSLRLRGLYLVFSTLALQYVAYFVFQQYDHHSNALSGHNIKEAKIVSVVITTDKQWYVFLVIAVVIVAIVTYSILAGRPGRAWEATRANEASAAIMGIDVRRTKLTAFVYSSFWVGLSGGITAYFLKNITSDYFTLSLAISYVAIILVGGVGSVGGAVAGSIVITFLPTVVTNAGTGIFGASSGTGFLSTNLSAIDSGVYGLLVLVFMFAEPRGLTGLVRRIERLMTHKGTQTPPERSQAGTAAVGVEDANRAGLTDVADARVIPGSRQ
ncbi:branched-chain amino acid ABC transporter permease [Acidiferrimicrobium sp. IK]|nr:branched-chain amino acid ABC transporter permease [Acidiferrimicrobium sp. IK]